MISRIQLTTIVYIAAAALALLLSLRGIAVPSEWFQPLGLVISVLVLFLWVFERWLWRLPFLHPWFVDTPNLRGTWQGVLSSTWVDPASGGRLDPISTYMVIRQTFSSIHVRLLTNESASDSLSANLKKADDGSWSLAAVYRNVPTAVVVDRSPQHFGAVVLTMRGQRPRTLEGQYWTNRHTKGDLHFTTRTRKLVDEFRAASAILPPPA
ncbi:MAG: hypothetical protein HY270_00875 [Deltaproteobacteria bacterium]|nr:hypothetical protein [Deltaproteobacteria bacterium]